MKVILETDRLLLREYVEEDVEEFFKLNTDPDVLRFVPDKPLLNVEQARQILIDHPIADYRKYGFGRGACSSLAWHAERMERNEVSDMAGEAARLRSSAAGAAEIQGAHMSLATLLSIPFHSSGLS